MGIKGNTEAMTGHRIQEEALRALSIEKPPVLRLQCALQTCQEGEICRKFTQYGFRCASLSAALGSIERPPLGPRSVDEQGNIIPQEQREGWSLYQQALKEYEARQAALRNPPAPEENILIDANRITGNGGDRNDSYDHPKYNFGKIGEVWTTLLKDKLKDGATISPRNVVHLMVGMKLVRDTHKPQRDNILDIAGYARCAERLSENV